MTGTPEKLGLGSRAEQSKAVPISLLSCFAMASEEVMDSGEKRLNELGYKQELRREMVRTIICYAPFFYFFFLFVLLSSCVSLSSILTKSMLYNHEIWDTSNILGRSNIMVSCKYQPWPLLVWIHGRSQNF